MPNILPIRDANWMLIRKQSARTRKPTFTAAVVSGSEVIEASFGVAFFAGELWHTKRHSVVDVRGRHRSFTHVANGIVIDSSFGADLRIRTLTSVVVRPVAENRR